jgi:hypothetical protein
VVVAPIKDSTPKPFFNSFESVSWALAKVKLIAVNKVTSVFLCSCSLNYTHKKSQRNALAFNIVLSSN